MDKEKEGTKGPRENSKTSKRDNKDKSKKAMKYGAQLKKNQKLTE